MSNSQTSFRTCQGTAKYIALTLLLTLPVSAQVSEQANHMIDKLRAELAILTQAPVIAHMSRLCVQSSEVLK